MCYNWCIFRILSTHAFCEHFGGPFPSESIGRGPGKEKTGFQTLIPASGSSDSGGQVLPRTAFGKRPAVWQDASRFTFRISVHTPQTLVLNGKRLPAVRYV